MTKYIDPTREPNKIYLEDLPPQLIPIPCKCGGTIHWGNSNPNIDVYIYGACDSCTRDVLWKRT
jgi:hypothetical protein